MLEYLALKQLVIATLLGSLIGLERQRKVQNGDVVAGLRTYGFIGLLGAIVYMVSSGADVIYASATLGVIAFMIVVYYINSRTGKDIGITSEVAALVAYFVGTLAAMDMYTVASAVAIGVVMMLYFKEKLHLWAQKISNKEIEATLKFLIVAIVVLPLLPNEYYGPYEAFNPYLIWLMVVFISGISFVSYIAIKLLGENKGITITGFLAGFISSTALAFSISDQSKKDQKIVNPYVLAIMIASTAMFFRVLVEVAVVYREMLNDVLVPMISMGLTGIFIAIWFYIKREKDTKSVEAKVQEIRSPFSLIPALKFAFFFAFILFVTNFTSETFGARGVYITSLISGLMDVDAITISMANLARTEQISTDVAVVGITIASISNTMSKAGILLLFGGKKVAIRVLISFVVVASVGALSLFLV